MASEGTSAIPLDVDGFLNNAYDSNVDADEYMIDVMSYDKEEVCEPFNCEADNCGAEKPPIDENFQPYVGMDFTTYKEACNFYNIYGYANGFSIRWGSSYKNTEGKETSVRIVCSKAGLKGNGKTNTEDSIEVDVESHEKTPQRKVPVKRCDCKAAIQVRLQPNSFRF